jgi:hypothetical protein
MNAHRTTLHGTLLAAALLASPLAFAQTRAAESRNFEVELHSTDRDTKDSTSNGALGVDIGGTIPLGDWFAANFSGGYTKTRVRTRDVLRNDDGSFSGVRPSCNFDGYGAEVGLFARRPRLGKIGVSYGLSNLSADCGSDSPFLPTGDDSLDSDRYTVEAEVYLGNFTLGASRTTTTPDGAPDIETTEARISWYPLESLRVTVLGNDLYDEDNYGIELEHQPEFLGDGFAVRLGYYDGDSEPSVRTIRLGLSYYFGTKVPLKTRDRQYR